ncbi:hypothetical protein WJX73_002788 [Symbiochloris irregularis]|uniref:Uncharacterized protein n=1 Tax=Symbiochloris irregularis TaxID=706552 RepID=A0AAW1Q3J4_9CHLO
MGLARLVVLGLILPCLAWDAPHQTGTGETHVSLCDDKILWTNKLAVVAGNKHSHQWLDDLELPHLVYQHQDQRLPNFFPNHALEAYAYLQFLYHYYDCLPEATALLHGHVASWHSEHMNKTLAELQWENINGYADLNKKQGVWKRPLKALGSHPDYPLVSGRDAYNGSFAQGQVIGGVAYSKWEAYMQWMSSGP